MAIEDYYVPITHRKASTTIDARGGSIKSYTDEAIEGIITYASSREVENARKLDIEATHNFYCAVDVTLQRDDLVVQDGQTYQIVGQPQNTVKRNHHFKTLVKIMLDGK